MQISRLGWSNKKKRQTISLVKGDLAAMSLEPDSWKQREEKEKKGGERGASLEKGASGLQATDRLR